MPDRATFEQMSDEQLARESAAGCSRAFAVIVGRYERPLLRFIRRWIANAHDAEDVAQDTFVDAWRCMPRYNAKWRFSTWLYTIASRKAVSHVRKCVPRSTATADYIAQPHTHGSNETVDSGEVHSGVWRLAERILTDEQRTALWLRYAQGLNANEIGRVLGRRPVAVRVMLFRSRERLAVELSRSDADEPAYPTPVDHLDAPEQHAAPLSPPTPAPRTLAG